MTSRCVSFLVPDFLLTPDSPPHTHEFMTSILDPRDPAREHRARGATAEGDRRGVAAEIPLPLAARAHLAQKSLRAPVDAWSARAGAYLSSTTV